MYLLSKVFRASISFYVSLQKAVFSENVQVSCLCTIFSIPCIIFPFQGLSKSESYLTKVTLIRAANAGRKSRMITTNVAT